MEELNDPLKGHTGSGGSLSGLPEWVQLVGGALVAVVVSILLVSLFMDWRRRRQRRRERHQRHVWSNYPVGQRTRPLAWIEPAPEGEPMLAVLPKPGEGEKAA